VERVMGRRLRGVVVGVEDVSLSSASSPSLST
jgi:hypothetical protein